MVTLIEFGLVLLIFLVISYGAYWLTEVRGLPEWLQYKPWICRMCLTFWSLVGVYSAIWVSFSCYIIGVVGILLAILNAIAMYIDQKNKTVKIDDL
jgi:hypothetical protein